VIVIIKECKSQVALEFIMMVSMAMVTVVMMLWLLYTLSHNYSEEKNINRLKDLGYSLQNELILAAEVEPGYERNITIPDKVGTAAYSIDIKSNGNYSDIVITYRGSDFLFTIPDVSGEISEPGIYTVRTTQVGNDKVIQIS